MKDPGDPGDEDGNPRSKICHEGRKEAVEAAARYLVGRLGEAGISGAVRVAFSGQGVYVVLHPGLSGRPDPADGEELDFDKLDRDYKVWLEAFNSFLADVERGFFEEHPEHVGRVKIDKLNNQKRKLKCLLSIHRTLPYAVVPLDPDDIEIDFDEASVPLSAEVLERARAWVETWESTPDERHALAELLKPYAEKVDEEIGGRAESSGEIRRSTEPIPIDRWCPFYKALLEYEDAPGKHRALGALATWLYQAGWNETEAFDLWYPIAARADVETRIFYTSYGVINSPNCETIQRTSSGYPSLGFGGLGLCVPDEKCQGCRWPGEYGGARPSMDASADTDGGELTLYDVTFVDDKGRLRFSPGMAATAILARYEIISTPDKRVWIYSEGIFEPVGEYVIASVLDKAAQDYAQIKQIRETVEKVYLRTKQDYSVFDSDPYLFCVQNGVIDMRKGHSGFKPHDPRYRRTWKAPVVYNPEAKMVELEKFLATALDEDGRSTLLDILAAKTSSINYEFFSPWIGRGQNGKTKAEELIRAFWGDDQVTEVEIATLGKRRFDLVELKGKSFLINSEVEGGRSEIRWIKHISGGGKVTADRKHLAQESFRPHCFIIYDCNRPPRFEDNTHGFNRRIAPIMWPYSFVDDPKEPYERLKDPHILEKITKPPELSGLLNVLIEIAPKVIETGTVHRVTSGEKIAEAYDMKAASGEIFWDRFVEEGYELTVASSWLYEKYKEFCELVGASPIRDRAFNDIGRRQKYRKGRAYADSGGRVQAWQKCGFNEDSWNEFLLDWTSNGPTEDQQKPRSGPARPPRPGNSGYDIERTEIDGPDLYKGSIHDYAGPAGPAGQAIDSSCPVDQHMLVQDEEDEGCIFGLSIPFWKDLARRAGGLTVRVLRDELGYDDHKAKMVLNLLRSPGFVEDEAGRLRLPEEGVEA